MQLNVSTLGTFYEMAREGAGLAADRLTGMTGVPTRVGVTRLNFMDGADLRAELAGGRRVGARVDLSGGFDGSTLVLFEADSGATDALVASLMEGVSREGVEDIERSALVELCHVMNGGFIDGWADVLDVAIDVSTPEYVDGTHPDRLLADLGTVPGEDDLALLFQSTIETVGAEVAFDHYLFPERETVAGMLERRRGSVEGIEYSKLLGFDRMADRGADRVAENLTTMTGIDMDVEVRRINFLSLDTIPEEVPDEELVSVAFRFTGTPSGYLVFVFDADSAAELVGATLPGEVRPDGSLGEMGRDAIGEFSNVMASGFLDGWANVLDTTVEHTPPEYTRDLGAAVVDPLVIGLSRDQEFAFVFDTRIAAPDREIDVDVYAIPDERSLETALASLSVEAVAEADVVAEFDVAGAEYGEDPAAVSSPADVGVTGEDSTGDDREGGGRR